MSYKTTDFTLIIVALMYTFISIKSNFRVCTVLVSDRLVNSSIATEHNISRDETLYINGSNIN